MLLCFGQCVIVAKQLLAVSGCPNCVNGRVREKNARSLFR